MVAKRLTRKEIVKQDPIKKTLTETSYWALENRNFLIGLAVGIVLLFVGILAWQSYSSSVNEEQQVRFAEALDTFHGSVRPAEPVEETPTAETETPAEETPPPEEGNQIEGEQAVAEEGAAEAEASEPEYRFETEEERYQASLEEFRAIVEDDPGSQIGQLARYYLGLTLIELGQEAEAREELEEVVAEADLPETKNLARNALAQLSARQDNHDEAIAYLQQILDNPSPHFPEQVALMRLAGYQEASGDLQKALSTYRDIETRFAGSTFANQAQAEISRLELIAGEPEGEASPEDAEATPGSEESPDQES